MKRKIYYRKGINQSASIFILILINLPLTIAQISFPLMSTFDNLYSTDNIIKNYNLLSSQDSQERQKANKFLMSLADHQETWITCQNMIQSNLDPNFVFLGAQLLYQKIQKDLHQFDPIFKGQLKNFLFTQLDSGKHTKTFIIDKLASSTALIVSSMLLEQWPSFVEDLTEFMKKSQNHLLSGLILLQRIPQQLRSTNRIAQGIKSKIQQHFLQKQELFAIIFDSVLQLKDDNLIKGALKSMQSWIRVCYPLIRYPQLVQKVLVNSLQNVDKLEICIKVICEAVKLASQQKTPGLTNVDPAKQQQNYSHDEITSIQSIVTYAIQNKNNFLSLMQTQPEYTEIYLNLVQQLLLSFGFLILEPLGFQLLQIVKELTKSNDLKLSFSTFEFWTDFSEKVARRKLTPQIKSKVYNEFVTLLDMFTEKLLIQNDNLMTDADLRDDDTVDDAVGMSFTQYRQDASNLLRAIYDYFVKTNKQEGAATYFKKIVQLIQCDSPPLTRYTQLGLYMLKSPLQSMINPFETAHLTEILCHLILAINSTSKECIAPIVLGETMNFIRDCTREIKQKDQLFLQALKLVLNYINDEKLCHHAAYCFQILMETINTLNDPAIAQGLVQFYREKKFTKQIVLQKMLQGIFNAVTKVSDQSKVQLYLDVILQTLMAKYQHSVNNTNQLLEGENNRSELYLTLVQLKTLLDSYDSSAPNIKILYHTKFTLLANNSVQIVNQILPIGIQSGLKFSTVNQIGLAVAVYRVALKILQVPEAFLIGSDNNPIFIKSLETVMIIINQKDINQYFYVIAMLSQTLIQFINHLSMPLTTWLFFHLPKISMFFQQYYYSPQSKVDPDVIKMFFTFLEGLVLYNKNVFLQYERKEDVLRLALNALKTINEKNMQRKCVSFIYVSLQSGIWQMKNYEEIVQQIFSSIPIIHSMCYTNLAKIFKILFSSTSLQQKQKVFLALLGVSPYTEIDQNIKILLSKAITMALATQQQRNIKTTFVQLHEIVWKKVGGDILMQLELKIATWKRQYNKKIQSPTQPNHIA